MASVSLTKHISPPQQTSSMGARRGRGICGDRSSNGSVQWRTSVRSRLERQLRASWVGGSVGDETTRAAAESACEGNNAEEAAASSSSSSTARMGGREFVAADGAEREREIHLHHHHRHHHRPRDVGRGLYRFTRPHTMIGTAVSITSVSLIATLHTHTPMSIALSRWLHATVTALLANVAIVGYNQLCDISIDAVNKPYLPLVNGDIDTRTGRLIVLATGAAAIALSSISHCMWLRIAVLGSLGLGWLYSSPLVRLKRSPVLAALSILVVRAIIVQLCFYQHIIGAEGAQVAIMPPALIVSTVFMTAFRYVYVCSPRRRREMDRHIIGIRISHGLIQNLSLYIVRCVCVCDPFCPVVCVILSQYRHRCWERHAGREGRCGRRHSYREYSNGRANSLSWRCGPAHGCIRWVWSCVMSFGFDVVAGSARCHRPCRCGHRTVVAVFEHKSEFAGKH